MYRRLLAFLIPALLPFSVSAQPVTSDGWYLGVAFGATQLDKSERDLLTDFNSSSSIQANSVDLDKSSSMVRAVIGRQLWSNVSLEGGYTEMGEYEAEFDFGSNVTGTAEASARAVYFGAQIFTSRDKPWGLYGKGGLARWQLSGDLDDDGFDPYFGAGIARKFLKTGRINFGVERYIFDDDAIDSFSIGFIAQY